MVLQAAQGAVVAHGTLDGILEGAGFLGAEGQDDHFLGTEHGGYAHGKGLCGHGLRVAPEETGVDLAGVLGEGDHAGAAAQGREGFVEGNVAVFAHAAQEQVKAAGLYNGFFVGGAFGLDVLGVAVEDMDIFGFFVNVVEQVAVHEAVVAFRVRFRQAYILVHVEGDDVFEGEFPGFDHADEFCIGFNGGGTGAKTNDERLAGAGCFFFDFGCDVVGSPQRTLGGVLADNNFHFMKIK